MAKTQSSYAIGKYHWEPGAKEKVKPIVNVKYGLDEYHDGLAEHHVDTIDIQNAGTRKNWFGGKYRLDSRTEKALKKIAKQGYIDKNTDITFKNSDVSKNNYLESVDRAASIACKKDTAKDVVGGVAAGIGGAVVGGLVGGPVGGTVGAVGALIAYSKLHDDEISRIYDKATRLSNANVRVLKKGTP